MSAWKDIPDDGHIDHNDCIIVRRRKATPHGGYQIGIGYKSVGSGWRVDNGARSIADYEQWCKIPE